MASLELEGQGHTTLGSLGTVHQTSSMLPPLPPLHLAYPAPQNLGQRPQSLNRQQLLWEAV